MVQLPTEHMMDVVSLVFFTRSESEMFSEANPSVKHLKPKPQDRHRLSNKTVDKDKLENITQDLLDWTESGI